ncbi:MAG: glycosyltransferase family 4 protein [Candidatus Omnitrophota bacterium]
MRILLLATHLNFGGIAQYVCSLAGALKKRGHEVCAASSGGQMVEELDKQGIEHISIPIKTKSEAHPKILLSAFLLKTKIKKYNIQIIHANSRVTQVLAWYLAKLSQVKFVSTCHGFFKLRFSRRAFPCWGEKVIAISQEVKDHLVDDFNIPLDKVALIYNGIDLSKYEAQIINDKNSLKKEFGLSRGPVIGIIARLSSVKGHKYLILAFKEILNTFPDAQLLMVGDGPSKNELTALSKHLAIDKNTYFRPSSINIVDYLFLMDVFVMPSIMEGLGLSVIEAQAAGIPVVASCIGGINSLIEDGVNGLLVPVGDYQTIAKSVILLLQDKDLANRISLEAKNRVSQRFSLGLMAEQIEDLYKAVLNK